MIFIVFSIFSSFSTSIFYHFPVFGYFLKEIVLGLASVFTTDYNTYYSNNEMEIMYAPVCES